jgi:thioredoxin reductase (NADPH)
VQKVKVTNRKTGEQSELETDGVFIFIGHDPNSGFLKDQLVMDEQRVRHYR